MALSIFETFNRLKRSNWREATQKATCLEKGNGKEPTKDKHHKSLIFPRFLIRMKKYLCFTFRKEGNGKQTLYFIMPSSRNLFAKKRYTFDVEVSKTSTWHSKCWNCSRQYLFIEVGGTINRLGNSPSHIDIGNMRCIVKNL